LEDPLLNNKIMRDVFVYSRYAPRQKGGLRAIRCFLCDINPAEIGSPYLTLNTLRNTQALQNKPIQRRYGYSWSSIGQRIACLRIWSPYFNHKISRCDLSKCFSICRHSSILVREVTRESHEGYPIFSWSWKFETVCICFWELWLSHDNAPPWFLVPAAPIGSVYMARPVM
jgi:hypothetical protein